MEPNSSADPSGITPPEASGLGEDNPPNKVSYESHLKLLEEKKRLQERYRQNEERLLALEAERQEKEKSELEKKGEYQKVIELHKEENQKLKSKLEQFSQQETNRKKLAAVLTGLGGKVESKFYNLIDFEDVLVDPSTGEIDEMSVTKVVEKTKATFPEIIRPGNGPRLPINAPQGAGNGRIARSEWLKLPVAEMKKYKLDQIDS